MKIEKKENKKKKIKEDTKRKKIKVKEKVKEKEIYFSICTKFEVTC